MSNYGIFVKEETFNDKSLIYANNAQRFVSERAGLLEQKIEP